MECKDSISNQVNENIQKTLQRFEDFKAANKQDAMKLRNAEVGEEEVFDSEEITKMVEEYSPAALVHFLNN